MKIVFLGLSGEEEFTKEQADFYGERGYEIWTMNDFWCRFPSLSFVDMAFQIHQHFDAKLIEGAHRFQGDWIAEYNRRALCSVVQESVSGLDRAIIYPPNLFTIGSRFSSTAAYMFAFAEDMKVEEIVLRCFSMTEPGEYDGQLPDLLWWIDRLRDKDVLITAPNEEKWRARGLNWAEVDDTCYIRYGATKLETRSIV